MCFQYKEQGGRLFSSVEMFMYTFSKGNVQLQLHNPKVFK